MGREVPGSTSTRQRRAWGRDGTPARLMRRGSRGIKEARKPAKLRPIGVSWSRSLVRHFINTTKSKIAALAAPGRILTLPPTPSPSRSGGEGRGEEELRRNHWQAEIKSPSPQPSPRASLRGEGVNYRGSGKMRPQTSQTPSAFDLTCFVRVPFFGECG